MWQSIRKFGLAHCDLQTMLWNVDVMLRVMTLKIDARNTKKIPLWCYFLTVVCASCYFYVYLISMIWFVFVKCVETGDLLAGLIVFSLGVSSEIGTSKLICMFVYEKKVRDIVTQCLTSDDLVVPSSRFSANLMTSLRVVKRRAMIFWIVVIGNAVAYITKPILTPGRHVMEDTFTIYGLDPTFESPNYEITFIVMAIGACVTVYLPANITALLIIITGYIESQMLAWTEELLHLWEDVQKEYLLEECEPNSHNKNMNDLVEKRLKIIIKGHSTNINLRKQIEYAFREALAVEFGLLIVGLIAELLGGLKNTWIEMPFAMMQVAMDCLTGQRLVDASKSFEKAVYNCKWERFDARNMKIVLVMLQNSQKEMTLSAGGVTQLNFMSLMAVVRCIYSAYTTLGSTLN